MQILLAILLQPFLNFPDSSYYYCNALLGRSNCAMMLRMLGLVKPRRLLTKLPYSLFLSLTSPVPADSYSAVLPLRAAFAPICISPPLVSRLRLTICNRGNGVPGVPAR